MAGTNPIRAQGYAATRVGLGDFGMSSDQAIPDGDNEAEFTSLSFGPEEGEPAGAAVNSPIAGRLPAGIGGGAPKPGAGAPGKLEFTTADILDPKDRLEFENRSASVESNKRIIEHHNENLAYRLAELDDLKNRKNAQEIEEKKARATQHTEYVTGELRKKIVKEEKAMEEIRARANLDAAELSPRDTPRVEDAREAADDARRRRTARYPLRPDGEGGSDSGRPSTPRHPLGRMAQPDYEIRREISKLQQQLDKAEKELADLRRQGSSVPGYVLSGAIGKTANLGREIGKLEKEAEIVRREDAGKRQLAGRNAPIFIPMKGGEVNTSRLAEGKLYKTHDGTLFVWDGENFREALRLDEPDEEGRAYMSRSDPADKRVAGHPGAAATPRELVDAAEAIQRETGSFGAEAGRIRVLAIELAGVQNRPRNYRLNGFPESDYRVKAARERLADGMPKLRSMYGDLEKAAKPEVVSIEAIAGREGGPGYLIPGQFRLHNGDSNAIDRIAGATAMAITDLFEGPYGIAHEDLGPLVNQSREDTYTPVFGFIRTFNEILVEGGSQLGDLAVRTVVAPFVGGIVAVGQTAIELGMTPTEARRLVRDLYMFAEVSLAEIGRGPTVAARVRTRGPGYKRRARNSGSLIEQMEHAGNLDDFLSQFPTDQHASILKQIQQSYEQGQRFARAQTKKHHLSTGTQNASNKTTKIGGFVDDAINDKSRTETLVIDNVDSAEAVRLKLDTGLDLTGYRHIIDSSGIRHTLKAHGNSAKEATRGQIAISKTDFANIPAIIANPDRIAYQGTNKIGRDIILYEKRIGNVYYYVEEVRTGRKVLALQSIWKRK